MKRIPAMPWEDLLTPPSPTEPAATASMRLLRRNGTPLLLLPANRRAACIALSLYPAQRWMARLARTMMTALQRFGCPAGMEATVLRYAPDAPFPRFLRGLGSFPDGLEFAMLLGNPNVTGRRSLLLLFNPQGQPACAVKAGRGEQALNLIRRETKFIKSLPAALLRSPAIRGEFDSDGIAALALGHISGPTPRPGDMSALPEILGSWIQRDQTVTFGALPASQRLRNSTRPDNLTSEVLERLREATFHPAIHHGDFAPWNIRVTAGTGQWVVLDWERGEHQGPPAWDWFHYFIQPEVLVHRSHPEKILERINGLLHSPMFKQYAALAGIESVLDPLLQAYLLHCRDVVRQAEGMPTIERLTELTACRGA